MAKIERGVHTQGLRMRLTLHSEDVDTHAFMTDHASYFNNLVDEMQQVALEDLKEAIEDLKEAMPPTRSPR